MKNKLSIFLIFVVLAFSAGCSSLTGNLLPDSTDPGVPVIGKPSYENLDYSEDEVLILVESMEGLADTLGNLGSNIIDSYDSINWVRVTVPAGQRALDFIEELENTKTVLMGEPNLEYELYDGQAFEQGLGIESLEIGATDFDKLWGMRNVNAHKAWEITTGSPNVIIAIADTGLYYDHPEFEGHEIITPYNASGDGGNAYDVNGHGSHVAGTAAANGRFGNLAGVAWDCPIWPIRVSTARMQILTSSLIDTMMTVADYVTNNPQYRAVVNMSLGGRGYSYAFKDAIDHAFEKGVILVSAAGNDRKRVISYPNAYNGVISVSSNNPRDEKAPESSMGNWVSVSAPGENIWSVTQPTAQDPDRYYGYLSGTSMSSPHVCGAVALLLSKYPSLSPVEIINQVEVTARPGVYGAGFCDELGYGVLDVEALLGPLAPMGYGSLKVETDIPQEGRVAVFDGNNKTVGFGLTGADGALNIHVIRPGTYTVTLSYDGLIHEQAEVTITAGQLTTVNLSLDPS